jgi:hypothetical protein
MTDEDRDRTLEAVAAIPFPTDRVRVTRTIVMEGTRAWITHTLLRSWVRPQRPITTGNGMTLTVTETVERVED